MDEKVLFKLSLLTSLIGILSLLLMSLTANLDETNINDISKDTLNVRLTGKVESITSKATVSTIKLLKEEFIEIVIFDSLNTSNLKKDSIVTIEGKINYDKDKKQLIADKISLIGET